MSAMYKWALCQTRMPKGYVVANLSAMYISLNFEL